MNTAEEKITKIIYTIFGIDETILFVLLFREFGVIEARSWFVKWVLVFPLMIQFMVMTSLVVIYIIVVIVERIRKKGGKKQ